jgi:hypothetical protein
MSEQQNLKSHGRTDPSFHFVLFPLLVANLIITIVWLVHKPDFLHIWVVVLSVLAILLLLKVRQYPVKVQDRVIRLEERQRLQALAPQEWHTQIFKLTEDQLIGLRFAGDDEVVELAKLALEQSLSRKQIKERIKSWRPDDWRV